MKPAHTPARSAAGATSRRAFLTAGASVPLAAAWASAAGAVPASHALPSLHTRPGHGWQPCTDRPITLPAVQRFDPSRRPNSPQHPGQGGHGKPAHPGKPLTPATRIVIASTSGELAHTAHLLAGELVAEGHLRRPPRVIHGGRVRPLDIVLQLGRVPGSDSEEAYSIEATGNRGLLLTAASSDGAFWATRTLLQVLRQGRAEGKIIDWPELDERALMVDIGRKHFSLDWLKSLVRQMSYLKMNTLQLHFSDGLGFRIESYSHPEIVSDQHLTKAEVRELIAFARRYHVRINADLDTPGHLDHILKQYPDYQLVLDGGTHLAGHLDFSNAKGRTLIHEIVAEMCELFDGPVFHLGGDEFFPAPWQGNGPDVVSDATAPQLVDYARAATGKADATAHDGYEHYLNDLAALVRSKGKTARIFNDDVYPGEGVTRVDTETEVDVWIRWNDSKPDAADFVRAGHSVINANGDYLYFILTADGVGQGPHKNPKGIYERWTPRTFMGIAGSQGDFLLPDHMPLGGAHLSVWCDSPESMTEAEVAEALQEWLQTFAQQTWGSPKLATTLDDLRSEVLPRVGTPPKAPSHR